jgi:hypothetical protein
MAAAVPNAPFLVPPGGAPAVATAPHLPFGGDPGTITGWLLDATSTETSSDISRGLERGFNRLSNNIPGINDAGYEDAIRNIIDEVIGSDTLITYLTAINIGQESARVTAVHSIHRYSAGFGGSNALHGKTLALLGETVGTQLPMLVQFSSDQSESFAHALAMENVLVPSDEMVEAYYLLPTAETVMPQPSVIQGAVQMNLACLCPVPLAWAPYFLDSKTPHDALRMGRELVSTMTEAEDRDRAASLLDWLRAACVRKGAGIARRGRSLLSLQFEPTTPNARVVTCMQQRLAPYLLPSAVAPIGMTGAPAAGPALAVGTLSSKMGEKEYSVLETGKIQAACGLTDAQWDTDLPELYPRMLEEGRTTARTKALLEEIFRPADMFSLESVHLSATDDMAKDVKTLSYGHNGDLSYESSHRGISPFTVIGVSMATASRRRRQADRYARTNNLTLTEVTMADTNPDPIPTDYHGLVNLLKRYTMFLQLIVGLRSSHYVEVRRITAELNGHQQMFETLGARQIASLLWQIFLDSRRFFSAGIDVRNNLPQSLLRTTYNEVAAGIVQAHLNVPYTELLLGSDLEDTAYGRPETGPPGGRTQTESRTFRHVPAAIKTILRGVRSKHPAVTIAEIMAAHVPPLQYAQVKLGPAGSCMDYLCFGNCKNTKCSYKHVSTANIAASRAEAIAPKLGAAYTAYDASKS